MILLFASLRPAGAQVALSRLERSDPVYVQHQRLVAEYHRHTAQGLSLPPLVLFQYRPGDDEDLFGIAARLMIPYDTLASLNRLEYPSISDAPLLVPSQPGLFAYDDPSTQLERLLRERITGNAATQSLTIPFGGRATPVRYLAGYDFLPAERDIFLRMRFANPLPGAALSSQYGYRNHPVTGVWSFHHGIDLAANYGTAVRTAAAGLVTAIERDPWLGLSVTVAHREHYETMYAHLQEVVVEIGQNVTNDGIIGYVGSSGLSTGPHLHFEIRYRGESRNPGHYIMWESN